MIEKIELKGKIIEYNLQYKNVKNINLRIKADGSVNVSAGKRVSQKMIDDFLVSKSDFIINALEKYENAKKLPAEQYFKEDEIRSVILRLCRNVYPYFEKSGIAFPEIKFKRMVSQWGNCYSQRGILTFNINLMYAPLECVEYVVAHEFTHFLVPNHSAKFYDELAKVMPDWRVRRQRLKGILI